MSQTIVSQKIERTCDGCEKKHDYEYVGMDEKPEVIQELEDWTTLTRELWNGREWVKMHAQALGLECVQKCATKMEIMIQTARANRAKQEEQSDGIDLNALRDISAEPRVN
jgi:hypothetical protein